MNKRNNIPRLRFKDYSNSWMHRKIRITGNVYMGHNFDKSKLNNNGEYPVIANGLKNNGIIGYCNDYQIKSPAITITSRRHIGHAKARFESFTPTNRLIVYKSKHMNPIFFANVINNTCFIADNLMMPQLTSNQFKEHRIDFPTLKEQNSISSLIWLIDRKIYLQKEKINQLRILKQAYLQKLLVKDDKVPKLRFDQFSSDWDVKSLGNISNCHNNYGIEKNFVKNGKYKVISIGSYSKDSQYIDQGLRVNPNNKVQSQLLQSGELVMLLNDVTRGNILGKTLLIKNDNEYVANQRTETIMPNSDISSLWLYYQLNDVDFHKKIVGLTQGIAQSYVNYRNINSLKMYVPTKSEGDVIGKFLDKLDQLLSLSKQKLLSLIKLKHAYIQKIL